MRGVPVTLFYLLLLCLVAFTVVLLILVIALLTLPAAIARQFVHNLGRMVLLATLLGMLFNLLGLFIAYTFELPAGATIILVAGLSYLLSTVFGGRLTGCRTMTTEAG